jgi:hypothetical protein
MEKKILLSMTVSALKAMCSKLFRAEIIRQKLIYKDEDNTAAYILDEDFRQLSFYSVRDGGVIIIEEK